VLNVDKVSINNLQCLLSDVLRWRDTRALNYTVVCQWTDYLPTISFRRLLYDDVCVNERIIFVRCIH